MMKIEGFYKCFKVFLCTTLLITFATVASTHAIGSHRHVQGNGWLERLDYLAAWRTLPDADISINRRGMTHIRAKTERDLFFALGFVHATERLFQMDLSRRAATGRVAQILGASALEQDLLPRALGIKQAADSALKTIDPTSREVLDSYTAGINAYLAQTPVTQLPLEFQLLNYSPEPWNPADSLAIGKLQGLGLSTIANEFAVLRMLSAGMAPEQILTLFTPNALPFNPDIRFPILQADEYAPPAMAMAQNIELQAAATALTSFSVDDREKIAAYSDMLRDMTPDASNGWVVSGEHTRSGMPLLANDPHLGLGIPSIWYYVHLDSPTLNVVGVGFPGVPGVAIGRNQDIAWGNAASLIDTVDFFRLVPTEDGSSYVLTSDNDVTVKPFDIRFETIGIRDAEPLILPVRVSEFGPVVTDALGIEQPFALSWTGTALSSDNSLTGLLSLNRATNWDEFRTAIANFDSFNVNFVYADRAGDIGFSNAGRIPLRAPGQSGLFPVLPADEAADNWQGYLPVALTPNALNPERGYIVAANQPISPSVFPLGQYSESYRAERITEMLLRHIERGRPLSLWDMRRIQLDQHSLLYRDFRPVLADIKPLLSDIDPKPRRALRYLKWLLHWNGEMTTRSRQATLFESWFNELTRIPAQFLGQTYLQGRAQLEPIPRFLLGLYAQGNVSLGISREDFLQAAAQSFVGVVDSLGPLVPRWGKVHQAVFAHPVLPDLSREIGYGGNRYTVNVAVANDVPSLDVKHGVSYRQLVDLAHPEWSRFIYPIGQSGRSDSPFFDNLLQLWARGRYLPMLMK